VRPQRVRSRRRAVAWTVRVAALLSWLLLAIALAGESRAEPPGAGLFSVGGRDGETVTVDADSLTYDREADKLHAKGDVIVTVGGSVLAADQVDIDRKSSQADATGSVVVEDPQGRIRAESASFVLEDETGFLEEGEVYLPQSRFQITGARLEKGIGQTYRIWDGTFTTCQCEDGAPDWSIEGDEIDIELGGWGKLRSGRFKIKDQPILYLPYGTFPILRDRQTGFLFPNVGYGTRRGFQYVQPFFWAIDKSSDLMTKLDVETEARIGLLAEYRYLWSEKAGGNIGGSYFNEAIRTSKPSDFVDTTNLADPHVSQNRWDITGYHQQVGPGGSRVYFQPFYVSDNLFLREMNVLTDLPYENLNLTTLRYTRSRAGITKVWDWGFAQAESSWKQDLIQKQSRVPQSLPRLVFQARDSLFNSQLLLRLNTEAVEYYRAPLDSGPRFDIAPQAMVPFQLGQYAYGDATMTLRETAYYLFDNDQPVYPDVITPSNVNDPLATRVVPHYQHREILTGQVNLRSEISRIFEVDDWGDIKKLKHTIEPLVGYQYVPVVAQDDLPLYDNVDRIRAKNLLSYGLMTRLLAKVRSGSPSALADAAPAAETAENILVGDQPYGPPAPPRVSGDSPEALTDERIQELGRAWIQQSYEISQPINPGQHFSAVDVGMRLTPVSFFGANGRVIYGVQNPTKLSYATAGINLYDPRPIAGPDDLFLQGLRPANSISAFYQFTGGGAVENINLAATYRVTNNFALSYLTRYDALDHSFLENWAGFRVISSCDCWVVDMAFVDRSNPDTTGVRVQVSLVGLGTFGQQQSGTGFGGFPRVNETTGIGRSY
jgi:LPS-assembly protein